MMRLENNCGEHEQKTERSGPNSDKTGAVSGISKNREREQNTEGYLQSWNRVESESPRIFIEL